MVLRHREYYRARATDDASVASRRAFRLLRRAPGRSSSSRHRSRDGPETHRLPSRPPAVIVCRMPRSASAPPAAWLLAACLVVSGAAALIYEVLWLRQLGLVMGHTAYALSTVLTAFLGGLALGAYVGGRWAKRGVASARLYAAIEVSIAVVALEMPVLFAGLDPIFG